MKITLLLAGLFVSSIFLNTACSNQTSKPESKDGAEAKVDIPKMPTDPVTLSFYELNAMTEEEFNNLIAQPITKKYPNITVHLLKGDLTKLVASDSVPDVIGANLAAMPSVLQPLNLVSDLAPLIKKYQVDLSQFNPDVIKYLKAIGPNGEIYALPHHINSYALYYNKDIFDKFGVSYPTNGMTWPQVRDLAVKVTRNDGGQYRGLDINRINNFGSPYSLPLVDPKTNKAYIADKWKDIFTMAMDIYNIPGNKPKNSRQSQLVIADPNSKLAMSPGYTEALYRLVDSQKKTGMRWGVVQYPSFPDLPNVNKQLVVESLFFSKGKNLDTAFQAVLPLISDEVQLENARNAMVSALKDPKYQQQFGQNIPELKDQDLSGLFKGRYAEPAPTNQFDVLVNTEIWNAIDQAIAGTDINTALKTAKEKADAAIAAQTK